MDEAKPRVLIVEDDDAIGQMYSDRFSKEGFLVTWIGNGKKAAEVVVNNQHEVVVLDVMLPEKNGLDILKIIRETPHTANLPVIILSAYPHLDNIEKAKSLAVENFFNKAATTPGEIVGEIKKILKQSK